MVTETFPINVGVRQGCILSPLLFNIFMADLPKQLDRENKVSIEGDFKINTLIWADDLLLLSDSEAGLQSILNSLDKYCADNQLVINFDKTKCMTFNKTGRLLRRHFFLGNVRLESTREYKYLGLVFTPSGEIRTALEDLKCRALKAYMSMKNKLGNFFSSYPTDTIAIFDATVKPILLYGSDFWGCLPFPKNNPIETLYFMFCKHLLGVHKSTTNDGVLKELGRLPIVLYAQKAAIKNWQRISGKANKLVKASYQGAKNESLDWITNIKKCFDSIGMTNLFLNNNNDMNTHNKVFQRLCDIYTQQSNSRISNPDSKLRTYNLIKEHVGMEPYLTEIRNINYRKSLTKFRLSNHDLMIETGRHRKPKIPKQERFCPFCTNRVEDEIHFLIKCPTYNEIRKEVINDSLELKPNFIFYTDLEKFMFLLTNEQISFKVSKLIHLAMEKRNVLISTCI